jgi:hypothetical protein
MIPHDESKWLVVSSLCFFVPMSYAFKTRHYLNASFLLMTMFCSMNYWRRAHYGWRRTIDIMMARTCFSIFFTQGMYYVDKNPYLLLPFVLSMNCYRNSHLLHEKGLCRWVYYHVLFHVFISIQQWIVIYYLP